MACHCCCRGRVYRNDPNATMFKYAEPTGELVQVYDRETVGTPNGSSCLHAVTENGERVIYEAGYRLNVGSDTRTVAKWRDDGMAPELEWHNSISGNRSVFLALQQPEDESLWVVADNFSAPPQLYRADSDGNVLNDGTVTGTLFDSFWTLMYCTPDTSDGMVLWVPHTHGLTTGDDAARIYSSSFSLGATVSRGSFGGGLSESFLPCGDWRQATQFVGACYVASSDLRVRVWDNSLAVVNTVDLGAADPIVYGASTTAVFVQHGSNFMLLSLPSLSTIWSVSGLTTASTLPWFYTIVSENNDVYHFFSDGGTKLKKLNAADGSVAWTSSTVALGQLYFHNDRLFRFNTIVTTPQLANGNFTVYAAASGSSLYSVTGSEIGRRSMQSVAGHLMLCGERRTL